MHLGDFDEVRLLPRNDMVIIPFNTLSNEIILTYIVKYKIILKFLILLE